MNYCLRIKHESGVYFQHVAVERIETKDADGRGMAFHELKASVCNFMGTRYAGQRVEGTVYVQGNLSRIELPSDTFTVVLELAWPGTADIDVGDTVFHVPVIRAIDRDGEELKAEQGNVTVRIDSDIAAALYSILDEVARSDKGDY